MKIILTFAIIAIIISLLYVFTRSHKPSEGQISVNVPQDRVADEVKDEVVDKICSMYMVDQVILFKDQQSNPVYFQVPVNVPSDGYRVLYSMNGEEIVRVGGLAPKVDDGNKLMDLTSTLQKPVVVTCAELKLLRQNLAPELFTQGFYEVKNPLQVSLYAISPINVAKHDIAKLTYQEAKQILKDQKSIFIAFGSPDFPGTPVTYFKMFTEQDSVMFQQFSGPHKPLTESYVVKKVLYSYEYEKGDAKGLLSLIVALPSGSKPSFKRLYIGEITKEQWISLSDLYHALEQISARPLFHWGTDDGLDR